MDMNEQLFGDYQPPSALEKVANAFRRVSHTMSMIPGIGLASGPVGLIAAGFDSLDGFVNKGIKTGTKKALSGTVDAAVTGAIGSSFWMPVNWVTGLASGDSLGELARKGTRGVLDAMVADSKTPTDIAREMQVLGHAPMTRGAVPAGIGMAAALQPQMAHTAPINPHTNQPMPANFWADKEAQRRGQSPEDARANYMRNNHEDAVALRQAAAQDAQLGA